MAEILSKAAFARRQGVDPSYVSIWIRRGKLGAPALRDDGKIDVNLAVAQLRTTIAPRPRVTPDSPQTVRAALLSGFLCRIEADFFPAIAALSLSEAQRASLARAWRRFRERESKPDPGGDL